MTDRAATILEWYQGLNPRARQSLAIADLHRLAKALSASPVPVDASGAEIAFSAGFHAAERALGFEGCDESAEALAIEWAEYAETLSHTAPVADAQAKEGE